MITDNEMLIIYSLLTVKQGLGNSLLRIMNMNMNMIMNKNTIL